MNNVHCVNFEVQLERNAKSPIFAYSKLSAEDHSKCDVHASAKSPGELAAIAATYALHQLWGWPTTPMTDKQ